MSETETLLDVVEVQGFKVKPWGIVDLARLSPHLERIFKSLVERGVEFKTAEKSVDKIIFSVLPEAPAIISLTLGISIEDVSKLKNDQVAEIIFTTIHLNTEYLKNWFAPITKIVQTIIS